MINWTTLQAFSIPQGEVVKVESGSSVIWEKNHDEPSYTNLAQPNDTNTTDWSIWINNARMGSDGTYRSSANSMVTNYIEVSKGDVIYFANTGITSSGNGVTSGFSFLIAHTKNGAIKSWIGGTPASIEAVGTYAIFTYHDDGTLKTMTFKPTVENPPAYIRLCLSNTINKSKVIITKDPIE